MARHEKGPVAPVPNGHCVHLVRYAEFDISREYGMDEAGYADGDAEGGSSDARPSSDKLNS